MTDTVDDFLTHYGVKGMKWGVRKERQPWSTKKKILVGAAAVAGISLAVVGTKVGIDFAKASKEYTKILDGENHNPLTWVAGSSIRSRYNDDSDVDSIIRKGHEFTRRSHVLETKINTRAYALASTKAADEYGSEDFGNNVLSLFAKRNVKVASYKQSVDTLLESSTKKQLVKTLNRDTLGRRLYQDLAMKPVDVANIRYYNMHRTNFDSSDPGVVSYLSTMMSKGYSAVRDQIDGGDAFVLFDDAAFNIVKKST